ncbi:MAG: hypothetical protein ACLP0J_31105 [Solirubrobacteraceae bacterium]
MSDSPPTRPNGYELSTPHIAGASQPAFASARGSLRLALPGIYQDPAEGLVMRFLEAFERTLDPRLAVIDCRSSYLDPELAPANMAREMLWWLGVEARHLDGDQAAARLRHAVEHRRGTRTGLQLDLDQSFPGLGLRVADSVDETADGVKLLVVQHAQPLDAEQRADVERVIEYHCPAQLSFTLLPKRPVLDQRVRLRPQHRSHEHAAEDENPWWRRPADERRQILPALPQRRR